jgi:hypothetical protein
MDINKDGKVTESEYIQAIILDPNLLEIFEVLNEGLTN